MKDGKQLTKSKGPTLGDLTLRSAWKILKSASWKLMVIGVFFGIIWVFAWGYETGTESFFGFEPVGFIWTMFPKWAWISFFVAIAIFIARGFTASLLREVGAKVFIGLGDWLERASLKTRLLMAIGLSLAAILHYHCPRWVLFVLWFTLMVFGALAEEYIIWKNTGYLDQ